MTKKNLVMRCLNCETIYDGALSACPNCKSPVRDEVLINLPVMENRPIVNFMPMMYRFPKMFGIPITSKN